MFGFKKKNANPETPTYTKRELMVFKRLDKADDETLLEFAEMLKQGKPVVLNFDLLKIPDANKTIAFLSGCVCALNGEVIELNEKVYLFADETLYFDGTIDKFLKEVIKD